MQGIAPDAGVTASDHTTWLEANHRYLCAAIDVVRALLQARLAQLAGEAVPVRTDQLTPAYQALEAAQQAMPAPAALDSLARTFRLTEFERQVLVLCGATEFDGAFPGLCAQLNGDPMKGYPTFSLALTTLPGAHWSALAPRAPLRRWRLIDIGAGPTLTGSPLRLDERVLHTLAGVHDLDERLHGLLVPVIPEAHLAPSHRRLAERVAGAWTSVQSGAVLPVIHLHGDDPSGMRAIAAAAAASLGLGLYSTAARILPSSLAELRTLLHLWEREVALSGGAWLLEIDSLDEGEPQQRRALSWLVEHTQTPFLVASRERQQPWQRPVVTFEVQRPTAEEQRALWQRALGPQAAALNGGIDALVTQFHLSPAAILAAATEAGVATAADDDSVPVATLWDASRVQARPRLDDLAQRIEPAATWADLVLPEQQRTILAEVAIHVRQRATVYHRWGFAGKGTRGLGISALFAGPSGTGKTTAAEVLANELRLDLYRIDLSAVVSKYIGETEKNLRRVFDAADEGGAILLFDEADALFGKRSEVKDSHDRYANIEVGYLLQRMETYRGLAILTTNMKNALDSAFLRRIRFVVSFPFPDAAQRAEIWRRVFPADTPTDELDIQKLSRLSIPGGNIRNIALYAAFLAADAGEPVRMTHLLRATRTEYAKMEKTLTTAEIEGWL
jgi:hypothetical protein